MKRWCIRSVFVGLLLLCVGGWGWSYKYGWVINYDYGRGLSTLESVWGEIHLCWYDTSVSQSTGMPFDPMPKGEGFSASSFPCDASFDSGRADHYRLGFVVSNDWIAIPFWFPTIIAAALLWWVWRKTRQNAK